ncbi:glycosyltransferase [Acinetobacter indicus]|uniref:glycosyltransferase n=1 Tax=Acinetobacter indicus TaxID=756892 RepID=UPI000CEB8E63|nr:glycosyltransferase [Acinetobacter indicus]
MSDQSPLVTVYIPTYNRVDLLKRAVESVRNQTYSNLEIIIVDDCSTDNTHAYLKEISGLDQRIRYFIKEKNSGACVSRNIAIENALGEYITGLDDDDYFLENRIEDFISNLKFLNCYQFLFSGMIFEKNNIRKKSTNIKPKNIDKNDLIYSNFVGNQIFCKTNIIKKYGGFDMNLMAWQDFDCWLNILFKSNGEARFINSYNYVVNDNEHLRITNQSKEKKIIDVYDKIINKYDFDLNMRRIFSVNLKGYGVSVPLINVFLNVKSRKDFLKIWFWIRVWKFFSL